MSTKKATVTTGAAVPCRVELSSDKIVVFDQPGSETDGKLGPTSTEGVSAALASCTAVTLGIYAERKGWSLEGLGVEVTTRYEGPNPSQIDVRITWPEDLGDDQIERLERIAGKCPVHRLLTEPIAIGIESA
jgi:putative redox protein